MVSSPNLHRRVLAAHGMERLPLEASAVPVDAPKLPRALKRREAAHVELLALGAKTLGAPMSEFRGFQLEVKDPPWMSMRVLAFYCWGDGAETEPRRSRFDVGFESPHAHPPSCEVP